MEDNEDNRYAKMLEAKRLYFEGKSYQKIVEITGVPYNTLVRWASHGSRKHNFLPWKQELLEHTEEQISQIALKSRQNIAKIYEVGLPLIYNSLLHRGKKTDSEGKQVPLSLGEAKAVTDILTSFDKLKRIHGDDQGSALNGEPQNVAPATIEELRAAVIQDKFIDLIPLKAGVDFNQVTKSEDHGRSEEPPKDSGGVTDAVSVLPSNAPGYDPGVRSSQGCSAETSSDDSSVLKRDPFA